MIHKQYTLHSLSHSIEISEAAEFTTIVFILIISPTDVFITISDPSNSNL